jgi:hypothetical protein
MKPWNRIVRPLLNWRSAPSATGLTPKEAEGLAQAAVILDNHLNRPEIDT